MKRISLIAAISLVSAGLFVFNAVQADPADFSPISGTDTTGASPEPFSNSELKELSISDDSRNATAGSWPMDGIYDEDKYLEFIFAPDVPLDAQISTASITHEYRRSGTLTAAKLEIWNGNSFIDVPLALPSSSNTDFSETKDITDIVSDPAALNHFKARFLAYRSTPVGSITTSHDFVKLSISYSIPTESPSPEDITINQVASPSEEVTPTPMPSDSPVPTPISTPDLVEIEPILPTPTPESIVEPVSQEVIQPAAPEVVPNITPVLSQNTEIVSTETPTPETETPRMLSESPKPIQRPFITATPRIAPALAAIGSVQPTNNSGNPFILSLAAIVRWLTAFAHMLIRI